MNRLSRLIFIIVFSISLVGCSIKEENTAKTFNTQQNNLVESTESTYIKPTYDKKTIIPNYEASQNTVSEEDPIKSSPEPSPVSTPKDNRTEIAQDFFYMPLDDAIKKIITGSSYPDEPQSNITYESLNYVKVLHYNFDGEILVGELIVAQDLADEITRIFHQLYLSKYPLTSIKLIDEFGGSLGDNASMSANNTSAFNYRFVSGTNKLSNHALARAIDINPMMNPYVKGDYVSPENGVEYANRNNIKPGMIDKSDLCYKLFTENGWSWGGDWKNSKDYQHFEKE